MLRSRRWVMASLLCGALLGPAIATASASAQSTPQQQIAAAQAQAQHIESAIEASDTRLSVLDEQVNQTSYRIAQANQGLLDAQARIAEAERNTQRMRRVLVARAADLYVQSGARSPFPELDAKSVQDLGTITRYSDIAARHDTAVLDQLSAANDDLHARRHDLAVARAAAQAQANALTNARHALVTEQANQRHLLAQVKGRLQALVQQEAARRQRAAEAAARAEMEHRAEVARARAGAVVVIASPAPQQPVSVGTSGTSGPNVPAPNSQAQVAVDTAKAQLGKPYVYAGSGPDVFDCSGLTMFAWRAAGVSLPHSAEMQYDSLPHVSIDALVPGDLVFYGSPIHHVGMFVGGGTMINAPQTGDVVKYASIYRPDFAGAARP